MGQLEGSDGGASDSCSQGHEFGGHGAYLKNNKQTKKQNKSYEISIIVTTIVTFLLGK